MNNSDLIRTLNRKHLLTVIELMSFALKYPDDDLSDFDYYSDSLSDEIFDYCQGLTDYQRLKLLHLIINTLISEAEKSSSQAFQLSLPLKTEA